MYVQYIKDYIQIPMLPLGLISVHRPNISFPWLFPKIVKERLLVIHINYAHYMWWVEHFNSSSCPKSVYEFLGSCLCHHRWPYSSNTKETNIYSHYSMNQKPIETCISSAFSMRELSHLIWILKSFAGVVAPSNKSGQIWNCGIIYAMRRLKHALLITCI